MLLGPFGRASVPRVAFGAAVVIVVVVAAVGVGRSRKAGVGRSALRCRQPRHRNALHLHSE